MADTRAEVDKRMRGGIGVLISGIPGAGHRMIERMLMRHNIDALIWHGIGPGSQEKGGWKQEWLMERLAGPGARIVIPTRDRRAHEKQIQVQGKRKKNEMRHWSYEKTQAEHYRALRRFVGIPMMMVSYEDILVGPDRWGRLLVEFCGGTEWNGWGERIYDGNEKYQ